MKEDDEEHDSSEKVETTLQTSDKTKWLLGIISCIGGMICLIVWGLISILNPEASTHLSESSMIHIDGNGIFLILCIVAIVVSAVLLLKNTKKK